MKRNVMHRFNPDHFAKLDDESRQEWQNPTALIDWLQLKGDESIIDIGAGTGYLALPLAEHWPGATVYAVDISPKLQKILGERASARGLTNIRLLPTDGRALDLEDGFADVILVVNVLHEIADDSALIAEIRRSLKHGGRLVLVDWKKEPTPVGPPVDERIRQADALELLAAHDFKVIAEAEIYPYHYAVVLT